MRVMHVTPYFAPAYRYGGPPVSILGLCRGLMEAGVEVEVLTTTANGDSELPREVALEARYEAVPVRYFPRSFPRRAFGASGIRDAMESSFSDCDLVHLHGLWNLPVWQAASVSRRSGIPYVVSPRGMLDDSSFGHHRWRKTLCYWAWEKRYLREASFLHATSKPEASVLERRSLGPEILYLPNGVTPPARVSHGGFRDRLGLDESHGLILFLGRLHPTKRIDLLVEAMHLLKEDHPSARLVLAGPLDGAGSASVVRRADASRVHWIGEVNGEEKWALLSEANALVLCSDSESFGMSVVEAMSMGVPVVVTRTCPWKDVETEGCGFWVEQRAEAIACSIARLLECPEEARAMGLRGRSLAHSRFDWNQIASEMERAYRRVLSHRESRKKGIVA